MKIHYCLAWTLSALGLIKFCSCSFVNDFPDTIAENGRELSILSRKYWRAKDTLFSSKKGGSKSSQVKEGGSTPREDIKYGVCVKKYCPFVCDFWRMTTGRVDHDVLPVEPPLVTQDPFLAVSIAAFGPVELLMDQLDNFHRYTMSSTLFSVHISARETPYGSAQAQACLNDMFPGRVMVSPLNFQSGWASSYILLSHLLNYVTLQAYNVKPAYFILMPRNTRLFRPGLECMVSDLKLSVRGFGVPADKSSEKHIHVMVRDRRKEFLKLFAASNISEIRTANSYHEGMFLPSYILEEFVKFVSTNVTGGIGTIGPLSYCLEEFYLQSWIIQHFPHETQQKSVTGSYSDHNASYGFPKVKIFGAGKPNEISWPRNAIVMDRHRKQCPQKIMDTLSSNISSILAYASWYQSCQRNYDIERLHEFYESNSVFVGVKRIGDHAGDFALHVVNAGPPVPSEATVQTHCRGPLWAGERLLPGEYKRAAIEKKNEWIDVFRHLRSKNDCIHESHFYSRAHDAQNPLPATCRRILSTVLTPSTFRSIILNTTECRASPYYFEYPEQCRGGGGRNKTVAKFCTKIKHDVELGIWQSARSGGSSPGRSLEDLEDTRL